MRPYNFPLLSPHAKGWKNCEKRRELYWKWAEKKFLIYAKENSLHHRRLGWAKSSLLSFVLSSPNRCHVISKLKREISWAGRENLFSEKKTFFFLLFLRSSSPSRSWAFLVKKFAIWFVCRTMKKWISFSHAAAASALDRRWWDLLKSEEMSINYSSGIAAHTEKKNIRERESNSISNLIEMGRRYLILIRENSTSIEGKKNVELSCEFVNFLSVPHDRYTYHIPIAKCV